MTNEERDPQTIHEDSRAVSRWWPRSRMLNVWIDNLSMQQLLAELDVGIVWTLNPDHLYHLQRNAAFYNAYQQADFITSDSKYVYWACGWLGRRIQEKVSGSDLVPAFCHHHRSNPNIRVFLLGAKPGVAHKAQQRINEREGREVVVGAHGPSMNFVNDEQETQQVIEMINNSGANVLIVGLGAPKQEIWITRFRQQMPDVKIYMGVGAVIDYEADVVKRAPSWMTRNGLEWVYRITTEPKRYWRRYLRDMEFFWLILKDRVGCYTPPTQSPAPPAPPPSAKNRLN
jgi:N-acetylglucosaminyldiphosphoundecaprenol N-acetyl-beta-D-mannosaminyltransferase